jgi:hypothetical protein
MQLDHSTLASTQPSTGAETPYVYPSFVRYAARTLLVPVTAGALHAGIGCAGMDPERDSACNPLRFFIHPNHLEQSTSLARVTAAAILAYDVRSGGGSTISSTAATLSPSGLIFGTKSST